MAGACISTLFASLDVNQSKPAFDQKTNQSVCDYDLTEHVRDQCWHQPPKPFLLSAFLFRSQLPPSLLCAALSIRPNHAGAFFFREGLELGDGINGIAGWNQTRFVDRPVLAILESLP